MGKSKDASSRSMDLRSISNDWCAELTTATPRGLPMTHDEASATE